jgi:hypothetical protein
MMKKQVASVFSDFGDIFVRFRRSDAGIMTEKRGKKSPKDESKAYCLVMLK